MSRPSRLRSVLGWVVLAGVAAAGVLVWNNRAALADDYRLFGYTPPAAIASLASDIRFTDEGKRYFYASHPEIEGKTAFNQACGSTEPHTTVLGCYVNYSIYIYDVTDTRLTGVQQVTAAHETLHAAYARLTDTDRANVDAMLQREYDSMSGNATFSERFSVYDSLSQADKLNELHSIFGTEVASLSGELETYYSRYFSDRAVVTADYAAYQGQFDSLKQQQAALSARITTLKQDIESTQSTYASDRSDLNRDIAAFNQRADGGGYSSQSEFNRDRAALVARSNALNETAKSINARVDEYNDAINEYNALSIQTRDLQNSLNSQSVEGAPTV